MSDMITIEYEPHNPNRTICLNCGNLLRPPRWDGRCPNCGSRKQKRLGELGVRTNCDCGQELPMHLFDLVRPEDRFSHICSCGRRWEKDGHGDTVCACRQENPFAKEPGE